MPKRVCLPKPRQPPEGWPQCYHDAGASWGDVTVTKVALFHFATKSRQDYAIKLARGSAMSVNRRKSWDTFNSLAECAPRLVPALVLAPPSLSCLVSATDSQAITGCAATHTCRNLLEGSVLVLVTADCAVSRIPPVTAVQRRRC